MLAKASLSLCLLTAISSGFQPDRTMLRHMFEKALAERKAEYGAADAHTAQAARDLGLFLQRSGEAVSARQALIETVRIDETAFGKAAPQTLEDVASLAAVSPPLQAAPLLRRAAESADPQIAGPALSSLADIRKAAGDRVGAAVYLRIALDKAEAVDGKDGTIVALILSSLAMDVGPAQGAAYLERAVNINRSKLGERDPDTIQSEVSLSRTLLAAGRIDEAVAMGRESLTGAEISLGSDQPGTAAAASALAHAVQAKGDRVEAGRLYRLAFLIDSGALGPRDPRTRNDARDLAALDGPFSAAPGRK